MVGGQLIRTWTSTAPESRTILTIFRLVVPLTMESSTSTTRFPRISSETGFNLILTPEMANGLLGLDEGPADIVVADQSELETGSAIRREKPMAAATPESGTGTTMSASTGCSCASARPRRWRLS